MRAVVVGLAGLFAAIGVATADPPGATPPTVPPPTTLPPPPSSPSPDPDAITTDAPGASDVDQAPSSDEGAIDDGEAADASGDPSEPPTGTVRFGIYRDDDSTTVYRGLGTLGHAWGNWSLSANLGVDVVSSASLDVRASPLGSVDVVTSASGRSSTSGGQMTDRRYQVTGGGSWTDGSGRVANLALVLAKEADYLSVSGALNGSYDVLDRSTTLLGGVTFTDNWISSVIDPELHEQMYAVGWSAGLARVLTRNDALRLRYDGQLGDGYHASPYRNVRFGDWTAQVGEHQITFMNTIGSADGLPELEPERRIGHALVLEWVHSLALDIGLHPSVRASHDSWGVDSLSASLDLRIARPTWRLQTGYRYLIQTRADFFADKYTMDPSTYAYYTSDKDLGDQRGHMLRLDLSWVLHDAESTTDTKMLLNAQLELNRYQYPGFTLLPSRDSVFASIGLSWEL